MTIRRKAAAVLVLLLSTVPLAAEAPRTLRLDYFHTGSATTEIFSVDRLVVEPLPWPGHPDRTLDAYGGGKYFFEVRDGEKVLYSQGFASIYGEWETTGEARRVHRTFHESLRFPDPGKEVEIVLHKRGAANAFEPVWTTTVDPSDIYVQTAAPAPQEVITIRENGPPQDKVDLLVLGDGYTAEERPTFEKEARSIVDGLFAIEPFKAGAQDFNVWAICPPEPQSGVSRPSTGIQRRTAIGATYDAFGSERYVLTFENRSWRDVASWAPYEFVLIMTNSETYGGGGIYKLYSTVAAKNDWADYLVRHEFAHHFAGLADEYYTSDVAYELDENRTEPWEANATALHDPANLKWRDFMEGETPLPTPWPKQAFEEHSYEIQERRRALRAANRPESEMTALFNEQMAFETKLFDQSPHRHAVGAFEGANYAGLGYYRPQLDCIMFSRNKVPFCRVCDATLQKVIDRYTPPPASPNQ